MADDKIKKLYKTFIDEGYDMEDEQTFRKNLQNAEKRKAAYDALVNDGYDMEAYDQFEKNIGFLGSDKDNNVSNVGRDDVGEVGDVGSVGGSGDSRNTSSNAGVMSQEEYDGLSESGKDAAHGVGVAPKETLGKPWGEAYDAKKAGEMMRNAEKVKNGKGEKVKDGSGEKVKEPTVEEKREQAEYMINNAEQNLDAPDFYYIDPRGDKNDPENRLQITTKNYTDKLVGEEYAKAEAQKQDYLKNNEAVVATNLGKSGISSMENVRQKEASKYDDPEAIEKSVVARVEKDKSYIMSNAKKSALDALLKSEKYKDVDVSVLYSIADDFSKQAYDRALADAVAKVRRTATEKAKPQSGTMGFLESAVGGNSLATLALGTEMTPGHVKAREKAMAEYGQEHPFITTAGTIAGMASDPVMRLGAGMGAAAGKGVSSIALRSLPEVEKAVGTRWLAMSSKNYLAGQRAVQGAVNFATYEVGSEAARQVSRGEMNGWELAGKGFHGAVLGGVMSLAGNYIGNATNRAVKNAGSKAEAITKRVAGTGVGIGTETVIFATPDAIERMSQGENGRDAILGSLKDAATMVLGFKAQHALKGAVGLAGMAIDSRIKPKDRSEALRKQGFWSLVTDRLTKTPETGFTEEEKDELRRYGYDDLADMSHKEFAASAMEYDERKPKAAIGHDKRVKETGETVSEPQKIEEYFDRVAAMMQDERLSETARAKMAYVITGRKVPMSAVMGSNAEKTEDGKYWVEALSAKGVISHKEYDNEAAARRAQADVDRQAELNTVDIGEQYKNAVIDSRQLNNAIKKAAAEYGFTPEEMMRRYQEGEDKEIEKRVKELYDAQEGILSTERPEGIRDAIEEATGIDVDKAIKKDADKRTEDEQAALEEYVKRLYPEQRSEEAEATWREGLPQDNGIRDNNGFNDPNGGNGGASATAPTVHKDGMVHRATLYPKNGGVAQEVYIVDGNVVVGEDGRIDESVSDEMIIYRDENGETHTCTPKEIQGVQTPETPQAPHVGGVGAPEAQNAGTGGTVDITSGRDNDNNDLNVSREFKADDEVKINVNGEDVDGVVVSVSDDGKTVVVDYDVSGDVRRERFDVATGDGNRGSRLNRDSRVSNGSNDFNDLNGDKESNEVANEYDRNIPKTVDEAKGLINNLVDFAKKVKDKVRRIVVGGMTERQMKDLQINGISVDNTWVHSVENSAIIHNQNEHGNPSVESKKGQIAITESDYQLIPDILENYDDVNKSDHKDAQGNDVVIYTKAYPDGTVYYLEEVRNKRKSLAFRTMYKKKNSSDSLDGLIQDASPLTSETTPSNLNAVSASKGSESSDTAQGNGENLTALSKIPVGEDGEPQYESAPVKDTWEALVEMNDGDEAEAIDTARTMAENAREDLAREEKKSPKKGRSVAEIQANKKVYKETLAALQAKVDYWNGVADYKEAEQRRQREQARREKAARLAEARAVQQKTGRYSAENAALGDYMDFRDYVMRTIATGGIRLKWSDDQNISSIRGLASHLGMKGSNAERNKRIWLLSNEGLTPEAAAHSLAEGYAAAIGNAGYTEDVIDTQEALNELLSVVGSYDSPRAMMDAVKEHHNTMTEEEIGAEEYNKELALQSEAEAMDMDVEDWRSYKEAVAEDMQEWSSSVSDEVLYGIVADADKAEQELRARDEAEMATEIFNEEQKQIQNNGQDNGKGEDGVSVVSSEQANNEGANSGSPAEGQRHDDGLDGVGGGDVQEGSEPQPIGTGVFGNIYNQFKGKVKEAIEFLTNKRSGEAIDVLHHKDIDGGISLVWGNEKAGLEKIVKKHPEILDNLQEILDGMHIVQETDNRIKLESDTHFAVISKEYMGKPRDKWLLTAYEKKNSALDNTMDTGKTHEGNGNDTATPESTVISAGKDTQSSDTEQGNEGKSAQKDKTEEKKQEEDKRKKKNKLGVSEEEKDEALRKLRDMLLGKGENITAGLDMNTLLEQGGKLARYYVGNGLEKFADFAKAMYEDMAKISKDAAEALKPYMKRIYMDLQGDMDISEDIIDRMDSNKTVRGFNLETLGKKIPSVIDTAREIAKEQEIEKNADLTKDINETAKKEKTPFEQWKKLKAKHPDAMLLFRVGDFYETYNEDAQKANELLDLAVTHPEGSEFDGMAGFPAHALDEYLPKLVRSGQRVAICDQLEEPKKLMKRGTPKSDTTKENDINQKETTETNKSGKVVEQDLFSTMEAETKPTPEKPKEELEGNSEEYQRRARQEHDFVNEIAKAIYSTQEAKPLTMNDVKKLAEKYDTLVDVSTTDLQELVELAMTKLTHTAALQSLGKGEEAERAGYDKVVSLYNAQPLLNARDSTRVERQQYSTPTPFGYVMGQFVKAGKDIQSVLEPSAGNGALTIAFNPRIVHVNDIDERRLANLRTLRYGTVTSQNGLLPFEGEQVDAMLTNPPFGTTTEKEYDNGIFTISSLEGQMAINALDAMKDNGRAAIVIGGNTEYRENGVMKPKDMKFFGYLYSHYNVVDVINLDGEMYARNGTKYPVRIILVDGRKGLAKRTIPPVRAKARAEQVHTFDELYKRVQDDIQLLQQQPRSESVGNNGTATTIVRGSSTESGAPSDQENVGGGREPIRTSDVGKGGRTALLDGNTTSTQQGGRGGVERPTEHQPVSQLDNGNGGDATGSNDIQRPNAAEGGRGGELHPNLGTDRGGARGSASTEPAVRPDTERGRLAVSLTDEKVAYPNRSQSGTLMSVVPANQAQVLADSLAKIGDVDQFLVDKLGYSGKEELYSHLAAEQVDSVALAINQMGKGNAFIIGDMTGVGKGRQAAALIRYAVGRGKKPIFFTQKPALFSDMYRDLCDIGSTELRPFILASVDKERSGDITDAEGNVVYKIPTAKEKKRVMQYINEHGTLPDEYDYMVTTYSQIQNGTTDYDVKEDGIHEKLKSSEKGNSANEIQGQKRRDMIKILSRKNFLILDESHTVAGNSGQGGYMQMLLQDDPNKVEGVTFLSATFAKRADNMPLYAMRTAISESGIKANDMIEAIEKGGVTLQEIMSKQLVQSGQMIRRERDFKGVSIDWMPVSEEADKVQRGQFNEVAGIFSSIRAFQDDYVKPMVEQMSDEVAELGSYSQIKKGTEAMGVRNTPFASKMYNLVNQLLFALKADAVADRVIWNLQNGFKPVISFTNTMEGFLEEAPKDTPMKNMPNFSLTLLKALDGVMRYQVTDADGNTTGSAFSVSSLSEKGQATYNEIRERIMNLSANLSISPMDAIKMKIEEAGYKVGEITGRKTALTKDENGNYIIRSRTDRDKKEAARRFNNGGLDVLMINKSGSTGISLHSSPKFGDTRQRVMVFAQFQSDINDEVQMRGRIDRTGQVYRGRYEYIMSTIPAEQRLQMMFKAKLKSLDANTTSSQKSKFNEMEVADYLNKYGDEVTWQYMKEHPELEERLGDPLKMFATDENKNSNSREEGKKPQDDCASKIARYLPFLPVEEQEQVFKDITDAYAVKIQLLNDAGENDLEITTMPLRAETKSKKVWKEGTAPDSGNAFAGNTYLEEVEVDVLKKPMKADEVQAYSNRLTDSKPFEEWRSAKRKEIADFYNNKREQLVKKQTEAAQARAQKAREKYIKDATKAREKGEKLDDALILEQATITANMVLESSNKKIENQANAITERKEYLLDILGDFTPLQPYVIPLDITSEKDSYETTFTPSYGTFIGFKFNKEFSLSSSTAVFATLDGRRKVELPLTKEKALNAILMQTQMHNYEMRDLNMGTWDSHVPTKTRKTAYIVTGNLLQALVDTAKEQNTRGYLVSYSTIDGETRQGILMPDRFKPSDLRSSAPISARLDALRSGERIESEDGRVSLERQGRWSSSGYWLNVPKSKQNGGEFFSDKTLRSLVFRGEFETRGNKMRAFVDPENIAKVLDRLSKMGVTVLQESDLKETKEYSLRFRTSEERNRDNASLQYREVQGFEDGETLDVDVHGNIGKWEYSVKGLNATFDSPERLLDAFRNKYPQYIATLKNDNTEIEVNSFRVSRDGRSSRDNRRFDEYLKRKTRNAQRMVDDIAKKLHLNDVEVLTTTDGLTGRKARAKGWYDTETGKITIVLPNHTDVSDVVRSLLHEGVAHHGLRELFGEHFDTFLDNAYNNVTRKIRDSIDSEIAKMREEARKKGRKFDEEKARREATEEYMADLAEDTNFEDAMRQGWWTKIKNFFLDMLAKAGINLRDKLTDNDLRYILWRSYENLKEPGRYRSPIETAKDVVMQDKLGVGNYRKERIMDEEKAIAAEPSSKDNIRKGIEALRKIAAGAERVENAMRRDDLAQYGGTNGITFYYGKTGDADKNFKGGYGVSHIGAKHGTETLMHMLDVIANGDIRRYVAGNKTAILEKGDYEVVLALTRNGDKETWMLTGWNTEDTKEKAGAGGEVRTQSAATQTNPTFSREDLGAAVSDANVRKYLDTASISEEKSDEGLLFRDDTDSLDRVSVRDEYDETIGKSMYQVQEALQDSMLGLKELMQDVWKASGGKGKIDDIPTNENAYLAENRMSSATYAQQEAYARDYRKPLVEAIGDLVKEGATREQVTDYMMAKHGLERNVVMAERAFIEYQKENPTGTKTLQDFRKRDYSGLTKLTGEADTAAAEAAAQQMVNNFESRHDTTDLWDKTNAATKATLKTMYDSGLLSKKHYEEILDMYDNYIPLRGFAEATTDEVYGYLQNRDDVGRGNIMKRAFGRTTKADDPIANIMAMAEAGIAQANRNKMKQTFLNFVLNHPSDVVSVRRLWLKKNEVTDEWEPLFANIEPTDDAATVEQKIEAFEQKMRQLKAQEPDKYKHGRDAVNIPYILKKDNMREHQVLVKRGGETFILTINGNPRAAQALNGLSNPSGAESKLAQYTWGVANATLRSLAAFYTTRNPNFVSSNFVRDMEYANTMVWAKESPEYAVRFNKNCFAECNPKAIWSLFDKYENNRLDMNNEKERAFYDFMMNGGETGYTIQRDLDMQKKIIVRELNDCNGKLSLPKAWRALAEKMDRANRSAENAARFAAFLTSRQMGRDIGRSVWDAKEISVNFNKKGAGGTYFFAHGQTAAGNVAAAMSAAGRSFQVFWNAGMQGLVNNAKVIGRNPKKALPLNAALFALGAAMVAMAAGGGDGDDDEDKYFNIPSNKRRDNLCFVVGDHVITIPLSVEHRAIYGLGELAMSVISGKEPMTEAELAAAVGGQLSQLMPIDFMEGGGGTQTLIPSQLKPVTEVATNTDWTGLPIYKDTPYNENRPEWTKAYKRTSRLYVEVSKALNRATGGNDVDKGWYDKIELFGIKLNNPAQIEHLVSGYFGQLPNQLISLGEMAAGVKEPNIGSVPIVSRLWQKTDERTKGRALNEQYYHAADEAERTADKMSEYKKKARLGSVEFAERLSDLMKSDEYKRYRAMKGYQKTISALQTELKSIDDTTDAEAVNKCLKTLREKMLEALDKEKKAGYPTRDEDYSYMDARLESSLEDVTDAIRDLKRERNNNDDGENSADVKDAQGDLIKEVKDFNKRH